MKLHLAVFAWNPFLRGRHVTGHDFSHAESGLSHLRLDVSEANESRQELSETSVGAQVLKGHGFSRAAGSIMRSGL